MSLSSSLLNAEKFLHYIGNILLLLSRSTRVLLAGIFFFLLIYANYAESRGYEVIMFVFFFVKKRKKKKKRLFDRYSSIFISVKFEINGGIDIFERCKSKYFIMDIFCIRILFYLLIYYFNERRH